MVELIIVGEFYMRLPIGKHVPRFAFPVLTACLALFCGSSRLDAAPVRGMSGDLWADLILGQPDYSDTRFNNASQSTASKPVAAVVDTVPGHNLMYVYDDGNNRVLGVTLVNGQVTDNQGAVLVLGQPNFTSTGSNGDSNWQNYPIPPLPTAYTLNNSPSYFQSPAEGGSVGNMAIDSQGNLYVPDYFNNRVLRYDWPTYTYEPASHVWGQPDFVSFAGNNGGEDQMLPAPTNQTLNFFPYDAVNYAVFVGSVENTAAGVAIDPWGNLWVADLMNNRVLRFPNAGGVPGPAADVVLGQPNFNTANPNDSVSDLSGMRHPLAVRVDGAGNVYVAESDLAGGAPPKYGRVSVYLPTGTDGSGNPLYGSGAIPAASYAVTQDLAYPCGLEWNNPPVTGTAGGNLWVSDLAQPTNAARDQVLLYAISFAGSFSATPVKVLLTDQPAHVFTGACVGVSPAPFWDQQHYASWTNWAGGYTGDGDSEGQVGVDSAGNIYLAGFSAVNLRRFPAPIPPPRPTWPPAGITSRSSPTRRASPTRSTTPACSTVSAWRSGSTWA
jgi:hypothetical protein